MVDQNQVPRSHRVDLMTNAELSIRKCIQEVETLGAHKLLTDAVILLDQAQRKIAEWVDGPDPVNSGLPVNPNDRS